MVGTAEVNFVVISNIFLVQNTLDSAKNSKMPSLSKVFESLSLSILITDEKFEVVYTNNSFNNFFDGNEKEIELKNIVGNKFYSELRSFANEAFNLDLVSEHDLNYTSLEGDSVLLNVRVQQYEENKNTYVIFIFKDVSQTRVNQKIKAYKESLDKMNIELDQFVYKTAHDLRAPLTNLIGLIGIMRNETDLELLSTYFDLQEKSVSKMDDFIQKITAYTKNTRLPLLVHKIDFKSLIDSVLNDLMYYDKSEFVKKSVHISKDLNFYSDKERLEIVLKKLLANAIKFSKSKDNISTLNLNISGEETGCRIVLHDNGIGIPNAIQPKVFDMFYRGHASADGAGIGLYIVKETILKLGGTISLNSEEGLFTEITLFLPSLKEK